MKPQKPTTRIIMLAWSWCVPCSIESVFLHANGISFTHIHLPPETPRGNKVPGLLGHLIWKRFRDPSAAPGEVHSPVFLFLPDFPGVLRMERDEARSFVLGLHPDQVLIQPSFPELVDAVRHLGYEVTVSPEEAVLRVMEKWTKVVAAGITATAVMTFVGVRMAPLMGIPRMNPAEMLAGPMGGSLMLGWAGHFMIGTILALIYALVAPQLLGPGWLRGAVYSLAPWLMAQLVMMPMMGMPVFSGSAVMATGSLVGHLVYGVVLGAMVGRPAQAAVGLREARARSVSA